MDKVVDVVGFYRSLTGVGGGVVDGLQMDPYQTHFEVQATDSGTRARAAQSLFHSGLSATDFRNSLTRLRSSPWKRTSALVAFCRMASDITPLFLGLW